MIILISPAKTLDFKKSGPSNLISFPEFGKEAQFIANIIQKISPRDLSSLLKISSKLAYLNYDRFQKWQLANSLPMAKQCILAYKGDVYNGLKADSLSEDELGWAQDHLRILSGLYGILRPLDLIMPYRLEFATKLEVKGYKGLYDYWTNPINRSLNSLKSLEGNDVLINLASAEYYKVLDAKFGGFDVITPVFREYRNGEYRFFSMFGKRARGLMVRYIIKKRIKNPEEIKLFNEEGYSFNALLSKEKEWVFTR